MSNFEEKFLEIDKKLDYITSLLELIIDNFPSSKRINFSEAVNPILESPVIKQNPMVKDMLETFVEKLGGS